MSDFELFGGFEAANQMDEQAFEKFKERMKANAAQVKALQAGEQKQKKQEDKLAHILLKFIKTHKKTDIVLLIARCLEENVPASFVLSIILLGNEDVQKEVGVHFQLPPGINEKLSNEDTVDNKLVHFDTHKNVLPLKIKITLDLWGKNIFATCSLTPHKIIDNSFDKEKSPKHSIIRLTASVLRDYLEQNQIESDFSALNQFSETIVKGILHKLKENIKNQKKIGGQTEEL